MNQRRTIPWLGSEKAAETIFGFLKITPKKITDTHNLVSYQGYMNTTAGTYGLQILLKPQHPAAVYISRWDSQGNHAGSAAIKDPQMLGFDDPPKNPAVYVISPQGHVIIGGSGIHSVLGFELMET